MVLNSNSKHINSLDTQMMVGISVFCHNTDMVVCRCRLHYFLFEFYNFFLLSFIYTPDFISPSSFIYPLLFHISYRLPLSLSSWGVSHQQPNQNTNLPGAPRLLRIRWIFSDWIQTQQSSALYVLGALFQLLHAAWLMFQYLRDLGDPG